MTLVSTVLAALLRLAPFTLDASDTPEARVELLMPVAEAIAAVARTPSEVALLVEVMHM